MVRFESLASQNPEANPQDVQALRGHLEEQGFLHLDDHEAVLRAANDFFSNYTEADIEAIVSALYHKEQIAALEADNTADADSDITQ